MTRIGTVLGFVLLVAAGPIASRCSNNGGPSGTGDLPGDASGDNVENDAAPGDVPPADGTAGDTAPDARSDEGGPADAAGPDSGLGDTPLGDTPAPDAAPTDAPAPDGRMPELPGPDAAPDLRSDTPAPADGGLPDQPDPPDGARDTAAEADGGGGEAEPNFLFGFAGHIELREYPPQTGYPSSFVSALLKSAPEPQNHEAWLTRGACTLFVARPPGNCPEPCRQGPDVWEYCSADSVCVPEGARLSAGTLTVTGLTAPVTLQPDETAYYSPLGEPPANLFEPGSAIAVTAVGAALPAFTAPLTGVGDMETTFGRALELVDGEDLVIGWVPRGDGALVEVALQTGWHGAPPTAVIFCQAPESAGQVVVAADIVRAFPPHGGIGLFQHISWIRRVSRALVASPGGPIEVLVSSEQGLDIVHNPW